MLTVDSEEQVITFSGGEFRFGILTFYLDMIHYKREGNYYGDIMEKITDGNYESLLIYLKSLNSYEKLFVGLFFICNRNFGIAREVYEGFPRKTIKKVDEHLKRCAETKDTFLEKVWETDIIQTKKDFIFFSFTLLIFLDRHLYTDLQNPELQNWLYMRENRGKVKTFTFPKDWGSPELALLPNQKDFIQQNIPAKKLWPRTSLNSTDNIYDGYVTNFIVADLKPDKFTINIRTKSDRSSYLMKIMKKNFEDNNHLYFGVSSLQLNIPYPPVKIIGEDRQKRSIFRFQPFPNIEELEKKLKLTLETAWNNKVDWLIFPELTIDQQLLEIIKNWLAQHNRDFNIKFIVAGSYHLPNDRGIIENRTTCIDGYGECTFQQVKINHFRILPNEAAKMPQKFKKILNLGKYGGIEDMTPNLLLDIYITELGRLAFPICLDFIDRKVVNAFMATQTNLIFVPAMSPSGLSQFRTQAKELGKNHHCTSLIANSCWCTNSFKKPGADSKEKDIYHFYAPHTELTKVTRDAFKCNKCQSSSDVCLHILDLALLKS